MAKVRMSAGFGGLSGRAGNVVFAETKYGTILKNKPGGKRKRSQAQSQISLNLRRANAAWRSLSDEQVQAWQLYCLEFLDEETGTGNAIVPAAPHVFLGYATKILQMDDEAEVPLDPPTLPFYGDSIRCIPSGGKGSIIIQASAPNAPGITTEILTQKLRHIHNKPQTKSYTKAAFQAFAPGLLSIELEFFPGAYALAMRFIDTATGRKTATYPIGKVQVTATND